MQYDRKVKYLEYREDGKRIAGAGFAKLERRDGRCSLTVSVSGLHAVENAVGQVLLTDGDGECALCSLQLAHGRGIVERRGLNCENLGGTGISYEGLREIRIPLAEGKEIVCILQTRDAEAREYTGITSGKQEKWKGEPEQGQERGEIRGEPESEREWEEPGREQEREQEEPESNPAPESEEEWGEAGGNSAPGPPSVQDGPKRFPLLQDKWQQLFAIYPRMVPFDDEREYLSIGPEDFVVLPDKYFKLANNSFLLHGYHNYHHLVLARRNYRGETRYYIGVPGNYFDREKQVAVMFGFESFECFQEPAKQGDYGYYMMRVEL